MKKKKMAKVAIHTSYVNFFAPPALKEKFFRKCADENRRASEVLRALMTQYCDGM